MQNFGLTNKEHYGMLWIFCSGQLWQSIIVSIRKQFGGPAGVGAFNCGAINCFYKPCFGPSVEILLVTNL